MIEPLDSEESARLLSQSTMGFEDSLTKFNFGEEPSTVEKVVSIVGAFLPDVEPQSHGCNIIGSPSASELPSLVRSAGSLFKRVFGGAEETFAVAATIPKPPNCSFGDIQKNPEVVERLQEAGELFLKVRAATLNRTYSDRTHIIRNAGDAEKVVAGLVSTAVDLGTSGTLDVVNAKTVVLDSLRTILNNERTTGVNSTNFSTVLSFADGGFGWMRFEFSSNVKEINMISTRREVQVKEDLSFYKVYTMEELEKAMHKAKQSPFYLQ